MKQQAQAALLPADAPAVRQLGKPSVCLSAAAGSRRISYMARCACPLVHISALAQRCSQAGLNGERGAVGSQAGLNGERGAVGSQAAHGNVRVFERRSRQKWVLLQAGVPAHLIYADAARRQASVACSTGLREAWCGLPPWMDGGIKSSVVDAWRWQMPAACPRLHTQGCKVAGYPCMPAAYHRLHADEALCLLQHTPGCRHGSSGSTRRRLGRCLAATGGGAGRRAQTVSSIPRPSPQVRPHQPFELSASKCSCRRSS